MLHRVPDIVLDGIDVSPAPLRVEMRIAHHIEVLVVRQVDWLMRTFCESAGRLVRAMQRESSHQGRAKKEGE